MYWNKNLEKISKDYEEDGYDGSDWYPFWRKDHPELIIRAQEITELEDILTNLKLALINQTIQELTDKALQVFIFQSEEGIKELRRENKQYWETKIEQPPKSQ